MDSVDSIKDIISKAFGDSATGPQWGAVGGTSLITIVTGLMGFTMGGSLGALLGVAGGVAAGAFLGPTLNEFWKNMGFPAPEKPPLPKLAPEAQADADVALKRGVDVAQPGSPLMTHGEVIVPNLKRFKQVSSEANGQVQDLMQKRVQIDALPHGEQRAGAITRLLEAEGSASKLLANAQAWDEAAEKWSEKGGQRDQLQQALAVATNATGKNFDPSVMPTPPMAKVTVPELNPQLQSYALDMLHAEGKDGQAWKAMRPQDKINYVWNKLEDEAKAKQPEWDKMGARLFDYFNVRQTGSSVGNLGNSAAAWCVSWVSDDGAKYLRGLANNQSDCLVKAKECVAAGDYAKAAGYARLGAEYSGGGRFGLGSGDAEAKVAFEKLKRYANLRAMQQDMNTQREVVYQEIQRVEKVVETEFPKFITQVESLESRTRELNAQLKRDRENTHDATQPEQAPVTPVVANASQNKR